MPTTLQDLIAQQAELQAQMAEYERPLLQEARDAITSEAAAELVATLTTIRDQLPNGQAKTQIGNVLIVLGAVPQVLTQELARVSGVSTPNIPPGLNPNFIPAVQ